jgi:hypothetical protein
MEGLTEPRIDQMGQLNNAITELVDKSNCSILEILFVLDHVRGSLETLVLAPRKPFPDKVD